jgi:hypothetical protein
VAIELLDEVQVPPVIPLEVNADVPPIQTDAVPLNVPASAGGTTFGTNDCVHVKPPSVMDELTVNVWLESVVLVGVNENV